MQTVQQDLSLVFKPASYWNYRLVRFTYESAMDPEAYYVEICEVYYDNDKPYAYCKASIPCLDSLDLENTDSELCALRIYSSFTSQLLSAAQKPIMDSTIFEKSCLD